MFLWVGHIVFNEQNIHDFQHSDVKPSEVLLFCTSALPLFMNKTSLLPIPYQKRNFALRVFLNYFYLLRKEFSWISWYTILIGGNLEFHHSKVFFFLSSNNLFLLHHFYSFWSSSESSFFFNVLCFNHTSEERINKMSKQVRLK